MLALSSSCRYFLYAQPIIISSSFYKLAAIVNEQMPLSPLSGDVYIFLNRRATHIKLCNGNRMDLPSTTSDLRKELLRCQVLLGRSYDYPQHS
jgi:hypothetical protein